MKPTLVQLVSGLILEAGNNTNSCYRFSTGDEKLGKLLEMAVVKVC